MGPAQELLGYFFQAFHRPARMMKDVDGLTHLYENPLVATHLQVSLQLYLADRAACPAAYDTAVYHYRSPLKCVSHVSSPVPVTTCTLQADPVAQPSLPSLTASAASYPNHALLANLPARFRPSPTPLPIDDPSLELTSTTCTGSHVLLSNRTFIWLSVTPQFGAIPSASAPIQFCFLRCLELFNPICSPPLLFATQLFETLSSSLIPSGSSLSTCPFSVHLLASTRLAWTQL